MLIQTRKDTLQIVTSSTAPLDVVITHYGPQNELSRTLAKITTASITDVLATPTNFREIENISVRNTHGATANTITVQVYDGSLTYEIKEVTLAAGQTLVYASGTWSTY